MSAGRTPLAPRCQLRYVGLMLGLTSGELTLVALLVFAVVSARFWPAAGARIAEKLGGPLPSGKGVEAPSKSERTNDGEST
jgi:hypothetical protein